MLNDPQQKPCNENCLSVLMLSLGTHHSKGRIFISPQTLEFKGHPNDVVKRNETTMILLMRNCLVLTIFMKVIN